MTIDPRSVCSDTCLTCRPTTSLEKVDGVFTVTVTNCEGETIFQELFPDMYGFGSDLSTPQNFELVTFSSDGSVLGNLLFDDQETANILDSLIETFTVARKKRDMEDVATMGDRVRRQSAVESLPQTIPNPLICLEVDEAVVFQISEDVNSSLVHYPVYNKEHLLNSNPGFDYGAFRQLASLIQSGVNISLFVHTFSESGTYYFSDSISTARQMVVTVMPEGTTCERSGDDFRVLPSSSSYLIQYGVASEPIAGQEPNFTAIFGIMAAGLFIVVLVVLGILIWRPKSVGVKIPNTLKPRYKRLNEPSVVYVEGDFKDLSKLEQRGVGVGAPALVQSTGASSLLENFNVKTFYDKLEDQTLHVSAQLARQQSDLVKFYNQILQQTETLKSLVSESSVKMSVTRNRHSQEHSSAHHDMEREEPLGSEATSNIHHHSHLSNQEKELMTILKDILTKAKKTPGQMKVQSSQSTTHHDAHGTTSAKKDIQKVALEVESQVCACSGNWLCQDSVLKDCTCID